MRLDAKLSDWRERIQKLGQVCAVRKRAAGKLWSDNDIFRGLVLAVLSNSTDWSKIQAISGELDGHFFGFDLARFAGLEEQYIDRQLVPWFQERRAGSVQLARGLKRLISTAKKLTACAEQYGSVEQFFGSLYRQNASDPKRLALVLGAQEPYKLPGLGVPLAAEALKNIGYDVAKPDRHMNRATVCFGLLDPPPTWRNRTGYKTPGLGVQDLLRVMGAVERLARDNGELVTTVDNAIWLLCAQSGAHLSNEDLIALARAAADANLLEQTAEKST
jgi:hypothetical protein